MTISKRNILKDKIIELLKNNKNKAANTFINKELNINPDECTSILAELQSENKVWIKDISGGRYMIYLTANLESILLNESKKAEQERAETLKNWYDTENAKLQFEDYPETKNRAIWSILVSWIAIVLSLISLMQQWMCNKPH